MRVWSLTAMAPGRVNVPETRRAQLVIPATEEDYVTDQDRNAKEQYEHDKDSGHSVLRSFRACR